MPGNTLTPSDLFFKEYQFVDVAFPDADTPVRVSHNLKVDEPEDLGYILVRAQGQSILYDAQLAGIWTHDWSPTSITLSSSYGPCDVTILLFVMRRNTNA